MAQPYDLQVDTDLSEDSPADTQLAIEVCQAFEAASADGTGVIVNGLRRGEPVTEVDGTVRQRQPDPSKMAASALDEVVDECSKA